MVHQINERHICRLVVWWSRFLFKCSFTKKEERISQGYIYRMLSRWRHMKICNNVSYNSRFIHEVYMLCICINVFVISNLLVLFLRCICWVYNPASFFLSLQSRADNHMEEDKRQHPQKSEASEVSGRAGNSQHSAGGLGNVRMQSRESKRRNCFQRTPAGLQWVGSMISFSVRVLLRGCFQGIMFQTTIKILQKPFHFCTVSKDFSWYNLYQTAFWNSRLKSSPANLLSNPSTSIAYNPRMINQQHIW